MTTPDTPPSLAALYAERAAYAYAIQHHVLTPAQARVYLVDYAQLQARIATQEAQWPARWGRTQQETP